MTKNYLLAFLILITSSCNKLPLSNESFWMIALLGYRQNVTMSGTFFGNFNADVKAVPLSVDGKCDRNQIGIGITSTDNSGKFQISFPRTSRSGGYVCLISTPKSDGTSRFFAVDQQREFPWTGSTAYNILVLPEPSTTSRSQFNVVSTMFNRMATQRLERLAAGNTDITRTGDLLKTANKQIVGQFGLSKGITRGGVRATSIESATPDLNDIALDFNNKEDPTALKFTVMIGGIQSLGDPTKPESYDQVVNVISKYLASGTGSSVDENGEPLILPGQTQPLSLGGNSLATQISQKVATFVQTQAASLGISPTAVASVTQQVQQQVAAVDKPSFGITAAPVLVQIEPKLKYKELNQTTFQAGQSFSVSPDYLSTNIEKYGITTDVPLPSGIKISINASSGIISGSVESNFAGNLPVKLTVTGTAPGGKSTTWDFNLVFQGSYFQYSAPEYTFYQGQKIEIFPESAFIKSYSITITCSKDPCNIPFLVSTTGAITSEVPSNFMGIATYNLVVQGTSFIGDKYNRAIKINLKGSPSVSYYSPTFEGTMIRDIIPIGEAGETPISFQPAIISAGSVQANLSLKNGVVSTLPTGLALSSNGIISGTTNLKSLHNTFIDFKDLSTGLVTVYNLEFRPIAPAGFTYPNRFLNTTIGDAQDIQILPTFSGIGGAKDCSISTDSCGGGGYAPFLPQGLTLDPSSCAIKGKPQTVTPETMYCIQAINFTTGNAVQKSTATILIGVRNPEIPTFNYASGTTLFSPLSLAISKVIPDGNIYYSTDNSIPTTLSNLYSQPISVWWSLAGKTLKAYLSSSKYGDSPVAEFGVIAVPPLQTGTAQTSNTPGDDDEYKFGLKRLYTTNGDNTVTYHSTGLTWKKDSLSALSWDMAKTACSNLGNGWRLPSLEELTTIVNINTASNTIDSGIPTESAPYWSDTASQENSAYAYAVGFGAGRIFADQKTTQYSIRCVKSDVIFRKTNTYLETSESTIYDRSTGLLWEGNPVGTKNWTDAISYCNTLTLSGKKWRLPNKNELLSLVDYSLSSSPLVDVNFFKNSLPKYWSSSKDRNSILTKRWAVTFSMYQNGSSGVDDGYGIAGTSELGVRCVSGPYSNTYVSYDRPYYKFEDPTNISQVSILPVYLTNPTSYTFSQNNFPPGLSLNSTTGEIYGRPISGIYNLIINANSATRSFILYVQLETITSFQNCRQALELGNSANGVYRIRLSDGAEVNGYCMNSPNLTISPNTAETGGWLLILNYVHKGGTNPVLSPLAGSFPIMSGNVCGPDPGFCSSQLGQDESVLPASWGHATPALLSKLSFSEMLFFGKTSGHSRAYYFKSSDYGTIQYARTGGGNMSGIRNGFIPYTLHSAYSPASTDAFFPNEANFALTNFPFYLGGNYHWGIRGLDSRWEVDDFPGGYGNHTIHRIYIR